MTVLLPWFALVVTVLAGWAIIKRLSTSMVLLFAGLAMISFAVICGVHGFLPKGVKPSGFVWFDIFELLRSIATKQTSGIGLLITLPTWTESALLTLWFAFVLNLWTPCLPRTLFWSWAI